MLSVMNDKTSSRTSPRLPWLSDNCLCFKIFFPKISNSKYITTPIIFLFHLLIVSLTLADQQTLLYFKFA